jgi:hypothetical protein
MDEAELARMREEIRKDREEYNRDPQAYYLKWISKDIKENFKRFRCPRIQRVRAGALPEHVFEIPRWLQGQIRYREWFHLGDVYFERGNDSMFKDDPPGIAGWDLLFQAEPTGEYVYVEHFEGSGSGYACCETMNIIIAPTLRDLMDHVDDKRTWKADFIRRYIDV